MPQYQEGRLYPVTINGQQTFARWGAADNSSGQTVWTLPNGKTLRPQEVTPTGSPLFVIAVPDTDLPSIQLAATQGTGILGRLAKQVVSQLPAPPTIPEPGWGQQVLASTSDNDQRRAFVRWGTRSSSDSGYYADATGHSYAWSDLINPALP